jgi:hypothetical protein
MGFIPCSDDPIDYVDKETGVIYSLKQPTDEVELKLIEIKNSYIDGVRKEDEKSVRLLVNESVDAILLGWKHPALKMPEFPADGKPSKRLPTSLKMQIIAEWKMAGNFTKEEIKK